MTNHKVYKSIGEPYETHREIRYATGRHWETIGIHLRKANRIKEYQKKTIGRAHGKIMGNQLNR